MMPDDSLTRDELLILLMEECAEVIQAAAKCLRFGGEREYEGISNRDALAHEVGELRAVVDALHLNPYQIQAGYEGKIARALAAKGERRNQAVTYAEEWWMQRARNWAVAIGMDPLIVYGAFCRLSDRQVFPPDYEP